MGMKSGGVRAKGVLLAFTALAGAAGFAQPALAQGAGALTIGSKVPQALKDVPRSLSVLTNGRLEQQNVADLAL